MTQFTKFTFIFVELGSCMRLQLFNVLRSGFEQVSPGAVETTMPSAPPLFVFSAGIGLVRGTSALVMESLAEVEVPWCVKT
jgi:hypothetical protein